MAHPRNTKGHGLRSIDGGKKSPDGQPGWAKGLRKLYDSVVEEPLPDSFEELLKKLDQKKDG